MNINNLVNLNENFELTSSIFGQIVNKLPLCENTTRSFDRFMKKLFEFGVLLNNNNLLMQLLHTIALRRIHPNILGKLDYPTCSIDQLRMVMTNYRIKYNI